MITKLLFASVFCLVPLFAIAAATGSELFLSDGDIDLLVGVPKGFKEPLDSRRSKIASDTDKELFNLLDEDFYINDSKTMPNWQDAEDEKPNAAEIENEYLDLLANSQIETTAENFPIKNEIQYSAIIASSTDFQENIKEQIETERELW